MKYLLSGLLLLLFTAAMAQPLRSDIKKFNIHFYQEFRQNKTDDDEINHLVQWWFDTKGNDSLLLRINDNMTVHYEYKNGKLLLRQYINEEGKEKERYDYQYKPDGSYMITYTGYGMKSIGWYNKNDKLVKSLSAEGNTSIYKYDAKGKLISVISGAKPDKIQANNKYFYNAKGWLVKEERITGKKNTIVNYEYNTNGLIIAHTETGTVSGEKFESKAKYQYNEKGLLIRKDTDSDKGDDWEQIYEAFDYKYY